MSEQAPPVPPPSAPGPTPAPAGLFRRFRLTAFFALASLAVVFVFYKGFGSDPRAVPFKLAGQPAPNFTLTRLDNGQTVSLSELKGQPVVINFWATWCGPCRDEHPVLDWGHKRFGHQVKFLGVVFEDTDENARKFLAEAPVDYPQLIDARSSMAVDYGVAGVPETYFIDRAGIIRGKYAMPIDPQTLANLIAEISR